MVYSWVAVAAALASFVCTNTAQQSLPTPVGFTASPKTYGPNGPWQAVNVSIGYPPQHVDLYPGGTGETVIFSTGMCLDSNTPICGAGGLYDRFFSHSGNTTWDYGSYSGTKIDWTQGAIQNYGVDTIISDDLQWILPNTSDGYCMKNLSIRLINGCSMIYPDSSRYPPQVGKLALNIRANKTYHPIISDNSSFSTNLLPGYFDSGYDQTRIVGSFLDDVSAYDYQEDGNGNETFLINLLDISIGVDHGASPFPYSMRHGLLAAGNSSIPGSLNVTIDPAAPYLNLPQSTCDSIASQLPVTYNSDYGLYFWNIQDPRFAQIVTSPSYLGFSFAFEPSNTDLGNLTIRVPFQLLNLTLDAPLINRPTAYFPCQPPQLTSTYSLGRAFLQAAFLGVNRNGDAWRWFLGQAPGPNITSTPDPRIFLLNNTSGIPNGPVKTWNNTWDGFWTPLREDQVTKTNSTGNYSTSTTDGASTSSSTSIPKPQNASHRLSGSAIVGIVLGCVIFLLLVIIAVLLFLRLRSKKFQLTTPPQGPAPIQQEPDPCYEAADPEPREMQNHADLVWELGGKSRIEMQENSRIEVSATPRVASPRL